MSEQNFRHLLWFSIRVGQSAKDVPIGGTSIRPFPIEWKLINPDVVSVTSILSLSAFIINSANVGVTHAKLSQRSNLVAVDRSQMGRARLRNPVVRELSRLYVKCRYSASYA